MWKVIYGIYFFLIATPVFLLTTLLTALTAYIGCILGGERIFSFYPGKWWSISTCYLFLCPVKVTGKEHIEKNKSYVITANHQGAFDIFLVYGFLNIRIKWMMKKSLEKIPFVGSACRAAGFIFVDQGSPAAAAKSIKEAEQKIKDSNASLSIFPEGSRSATGKMGRFKKGAFQIAMDQQLPILPVTLNGPYEVLPIHKLFVKPHRMEVIIHPPIEVKDLEFSPKTIISLANQTRECIETGLWDKYK